MLRAAVVLVLLAGPAGAAAAQDSLGAARDLYTSADYNESLAMLTRLRTAASDAADARAIDQYRAFALFALGRTAEAELVVEAITAADPAWTLPSGEAPPRLAALFAQARERALPGVVRTRLNAARALYAEKRFGEAAEGFTTVLTLLEDKEVARVVGPDSTSIVALATGFRDLSLAADEQSRASEARKADTDAPTQVAASGSSPPAEGATPSASTEPAPSNSAPPAGETSTTPAPGTAPEPSSVEIVPPVAIAQAIPRPNDVAVPLGSAQIILLDIVIDENGRVEKAEIRQSVNKIYEGQLLNATRGWRYRPATQGGRPVKYARTLEVTLNPRKE